MSEFDDFFNEFFGDGQKNNKDENRNNEDFNDGELDQDRIDSVERFINMINSFDPNSEESLADSLTRELGEPNEIEYFNDNDFHYEKRTWYTPGGKIVKVRMISSDETPEEFYHHNLLDSSLEDELEQAIKNEDFEEAARLRDLINKRK